MIIDIEALLSDISEDAPCGEDLSYDSDMLELETAFQGKPEQQVGDSIVEAVQPNWPDVREKAGELLSRSHDLRIIVQYTVAMTAEEGFPGLHAGLSLLHQTLERHWDHVHPQLDPEDDNDPLERVNIIAGLNVAPNTLGDPVKFREHVQGAALTNSRGFGKICYRDIMHAQSGVPAGDNNEDGARQVSSSEIQAAFQDTDLDELITIHEAVQGAREAVSSIDTILVEKVGVGSATSFDGLQDDLKAIETELAERLRQQGHGVESADDDDEDGDGGGGGGTALSGDVNTARDAELALDKVCRYYELHEPSSPVPILVKVARSMISKSFLEISAALPPDTVELIVRICSSEGDEIDL